MIVGGGSTILLTISGINIPFGIDHNRHGWVLAVDQGGILGHRRVRDLAQEHGIQVPYLDFGYQLVRGFDERVK